MSGHRQHIADDEIVDETGTTWDVELSGHLRHRDPRRAAVVTLTTSDDDGEVAAEIEIPLVELRRLVRRFSVWPTPARVPRTTRGAS